MPDHPHIDPSTFQGFPYPKVLSDAEKAQLDYARREAGESLIFLIKSINNPDPQIQAGIDFNVQQYVSLQAEYTVAVWRARNKLGTL